jgi:hypothetical protein
MIYFQNKITYLGILCTVLGCKMLVNLMTNGNICITATWYTLWPFGMVCGHLVQFSRFGMFGPRKIWQP